MKQWRQVDGEDGRPFPGLLVNDQDNSKILFAGCNELTANVMTFLNGLRDGAKREPLTEVPENVWAAWHRGGSYEIAPNLLAALNAYIAGEQPATIKSCLTDDTPASAAEPYDDNFAQYGFDDTVDLLKRADNIRSAIPRTFYVFNDNCAQKLSNKEKWAMVLAGGIIDELLRKIAAETPASHKSAVAEKLADCQTMPDFSTPARAEGQTKQEMWKVWDTEKNQEASVAGYFSEQTCLYAIIGYLRRQIKGGRPDCDATVLWPKRVDAEAPATQPTEQAGEIDLDMVERKRFELWKLSQSVRDQDACRIGEMTSEVFDCLIAELRKRGGNG